MRKTYLRDVKLYTIWHQNGIKKQFEIFFFYERAITKKKWHLEGKITYLNKATPNRASFIKDLRNW